MTFRPETEKLGKALKIVLFEPDIKSISYY